MTNPIWRGDPEPDDRIPSDRIAAFKWTPAGLVELTDEEYQAECAKRAREWEGRDGDPGTVLHYKPDWAKPGKPW